MFIATVLDTAGWNRLKELPELFNRFQPFVLYEHFQWGRKYDQSYRSIFISFYLFNIMIAK